MSAEAVKSRASYGPVSPKGAALLFSFSSVSLGLSYTATQWISAHTAEMGISHRGPVSQRVKIFSTIRNRSPGPIKTMIWDFKSSCVLLSAN